MNARKLLLCSHWWSEQAESPPGEQDSVQAACLGGCKRWSRCKNSCWRHFNPVFFTPPRPAFETKTCPRSSYIKSYFFYFYLFLQAQKNERESIRQKLALGSFFDDGPGIYTSCSKSGKPSLSSRWALRQSWNSLSSPQGRVIDTWKAQQLCFVSLALVNQNVLGENIK